MGRVRWDWTGSGHQSTVHTDRTSLTAAEATPANSAPVYGKTSDCERHSLWIPLWDRQFHSAQYADVAVDCVRRVMRETVKVNYTRTAS
jgi:hypothetical protein